MMVMRWCRKATIFARPFFLSESVVGIPSYIHQSSRYAVKVQPSFLFSGHQYATESSCRLVNGNKDENNTNKADLQIISIESIKPASPTPHYLRTFNLSILDQSMYGFYTPVILFFPNTDNACVADVVTVRSRRLKESLSKLLTRYYPFAGEIKDNFHIDCNDKGAYFVQARVNQTLVEFLSQPDDQKVRELIPRHPITTESGNYVTSFQVNVFNCGGIGLCMSLTHKIMDGHSFFMFMKAWTAAARGLPVAISPSSVASEVFPYNPSLKYYLPSKLTTTKVASAKRFVFDSTALASLKAQLVACTDSPTSSPSRGPTRTEATATLIWKAAAKAASTVRPFSPQSPHGLLSVVNIRKRASPPLPNESIGNLIEVAVAMCFPRSQPDLPTLMSQMRESIAKINSDHIESLKGEKGHQVFDALLKKMNDLTDVTDEGDWLYVTSLLNSGIYEVDFGWGKPIWFYYMNPGLSRLVALNDMVNGGGVEAIVSLSSKEMEIFERDPEVLSYATVNPSPLGFLN